MEFERSELMAVFLVEAEEQLQLLEQQILMLEDEDSEKAKVVQNLFRIAHTLKGSSAAMGFEQLKRLTHEMENILDKLRNGKLEVNERVVNALFHCLDMLQRLVSDIVHGRTERRELQPVLAQLQGLEAGEAAAASTAAAPAPMEALDPGQQSAWLMAEAQGLRAYICEASFAEASEMQAARMMVMHSDLRELGTVAAAVPDIGLIRENEHVPCVTFYFNCGDSPDSLERLWRGWVLTGLVVSVVLKDVTGRVLMRSDDRCRAAAEEAIHNKDIRDVRTENAGRARQPEDVRKLSPTVRVDVDRLESLMNLVGELVIDQTRIAQVGTILRDGYSDEAVDDLEQISNHISRVIGELQESVMKTRMLPIEQLFNRFPRMVRDLAQALNKEVHLVISGKETELDRTVIEEIGDPLIHLIRNAIDHGIEDGAARIKDGKPAKGTVHIRAHHQDNQVVLTIEDDGAGIHAEKVKQSALRKELISSQEAEMMTEQELIQLIFTPGFSTAKEVSEVSGRGVGMDIVRSHIEKLNGLIEVETKVGAGTRFTIKLPLTLAILRGLLIKLRETTYALPMSSVVEIVRIPRKEIQSIKGQTVVKIREKALPLVWLHDYFKMQRDERARANVFIVVVGVAEKRIGLVVDELTGNQEIVVKSIGSYVGKVEGISGATILGDGSVSLILDIASIFKLVERERSAGKEEWETAI